MAKKTETDIEEVEEIVEEVIEEKPTLPTMDKVFKKEEVQRWLANASFRLAYPKWMNVKIEAGVADPDRQGVFALNHIGKTVHRSGALFVPAEFSEAADILFVRGFVYEGDVEEFMKFTREYIY